MIEKILLRIEAQEIHREIKRERKETLRTMRAEMRKKYCREIWLETNPLPRLMKQYLRQNGYSKLISLCESVAEQVAREQYSKPKTQGYEMEHLEKALRPLINMLKKTPLPDGTYRNAKLFKNLVIYWIQNGLSDDQIRRESKEVLHMTKDKRPSDFFGWVRWARQQISEGKLLQVNLKELNEWVDAANLEVNNG